MHTQQREIEAILADEGWIIVERQRQPEWWLDEVWELESAWSPTGTRAYVSFLVDPQAPIQRTEGTDVWAVCVTPQAPAGGATAEEPVPLKGWSKRRQEVRERIRGLRSRTKQDRHRT